GEVADDPALAAIDGVKDVAALRQLERRVVAPWARAAPPVEVAVAFDLDHVRAVAGEHVRNERPGPAPRQVDDAQLAGRPGAVGARSGVSGLAGELARGRTGDAKVAARFRADVPPE